MDERDSASAPGVLVVDDDPLTRKMVGAILQRNGFAVWLATDGYEALKLYQEHRDEIDTAILDVVMPDLDGPATLAALHKIEPRPICCFCTGGSNRYTSEELLALGAAHVLTKPIAATILTSTLKRLCHLGGDEKHGWPTRATAREPGR